MNARSKYSSDFQAIFKRTSCSKISTAQKATKKGSIGLHVWCCPLEFVAILLTVRRAAGTNTNGKKNKANEMNTINADVCRDLMPFFVCHYKKNS